MSAAVGARAFRGEGRQGGARQAAPRTRRHANGPTARTQAVDKRKEVGRLVVDLWRRGKGVLEVRLEHLADVCAMENAVGGGKKKVRVAQQSHAGAPSPNAVAEGSG